MNMGELKDWVDEKLETDLERGDDVYIQMNNTRIEIKDIGIDTDGAPIIYAGDEVP
jgi:hypothetical protein